MDNEISVDEDIRDIIEKSILPPLIEKWYKFLSQSS